MMVWGWERVWNAWGGLPRSPQVPPSPPGLHGEGNIMRESVTDGVLVLPHMHPAITLHIKYQRGPPPRKTAEKPWKKVPLREQNTKRQVKSQNLQASLVEKFFYHISILPSSLKPELGWKWTELVGSIYYLWSIKTVRPGRDGGTSNIASSTSERRQIAVEIHSTQCSDYEKLDSITE